jgi:hypothetical protein
MVAANIVAELVLGSQLSVLSKVECKTKALTAEFTEEHRELREP